MLGESFNARFQTIPRWGWHVTVFLLSSAIIISRRPEIIFRPQFYAEEGQMFYAQAYNVGLVHPLFWSYGGYLHIFPRLVADLAQLFPLVCAPLLFNLVAMMVQVLPVQMLLSSRLSAIGRLPARLFLALLYLCLPNSSEIHANLTNVHPRLATIAFLVMVSSLPRSNGARVFDFLAVLMCGLTGPYVIMLTPAAFLAWRESRERWKLILTSTLTAGAAIQSLLILIAGLSHRMKEALGANFVSLIEILANHVFLGALIGRNALFHAHPLGALVVACLGITALLYGLIRGPLQLKLLILFAGLVLAGSLASPMSFPIISGVPSGSRLPGWQALAFGWGQRYWYLPMLAFLATVVWLLKPTTPVALHLGAILCLVLLPFGVARDWRCLPSVDLHFREYAEKFRQAPPGTVWVIPLNPPGWSMRLTKH
jgi:hypothetical protein